MNVVIDGVRYIPAAAPCKDPTLLDYVHDFMDVGRVTIREYLCALLTALWDKGEGFSGKRPFGNSGWEYELWSALVAAGAVLGELDEDGRYQSMSNEAKEEASAIVLALIGEMCKPK